MPPEVGGSPAITPLRRNRDFAILWSGQAVSALGSSMSLLVFPLLGYAITRSATVAGLIPASALLGKVVVGLPAGALVDRWSRRRVLLMGNVAGLAVFGSLAGATLAGRLTLAHLIAGAFASGVVSAFLDPAASVAVRTVVPTEQLPQAYTRLEARQHAVDLSGPPLGGALYSIVRGLPFLVDAISYCVAALSITRLRSALDAPTTRDGDQSFRTALVEGLAFVWRERVIRALILWSAAFNFAVIFVVAGVTLRLIQGGVHPAVIGVVDAVAAAAGLVGAALASTVIQRIPTGPLAIATSLVFGAIITPMAWTHNVVIIGSLLACGVVLLPANVAGLSAYMSAATPDRLQGRMNAAAGLISTGATPAGPIVAGALVGSVGGGPATLSGAALIILTTAPLLANPVVRSLGRPESWAAALTSAGQ